MCNEEIISKLYDSPIEFMKEYIEILSLHSNSPKRILYNELAYSNVFEHALFHYVFNLGQSEKVNIDDFTEIEELLLRCSTLKLNDIAFYQASVIQYAKSIAILLDRIETDIKNGDFMNIEVFFYFCSLELDLTVVLIKIIEKNYCLTEILNDSNSLNFTEEELQFWRDFITRIECINQSLFNDQRSFITSSRELRKRYIPSDILLGLNRVTVYSLGQCLIYMIDKLLISSDDKYVLTMDLICAFSLENLINRDDILIMKEFANMLLI